MLTQPERGCLLVARPREGLGMFKNTGGCSWWEHDALPCMMVAAGWEHDRLPWLCLVACPLPSHLPPPAVACPVLAARHLCAPS